MPSAGGVHLIIYGHKRTVPFTKLGTGASVRPGSIRRSSTTCASSRIMAGCRGGRRAGSPDLRGGNAMDAVEGLIAKLRANPALAGKPFAVVFKLTAKEGQEYEGQKAGPR